jgi:hypothetical protein
MKDNQIRLALKGAKTECGHDTKPKDIVFRVLENAMQVDGNLPDRDGHFELRTLWPPVLRPRKEQAEAYAAILHRVLNGEAIPSELEPRCWMTPQQIAQADAVLEVFPKLLVGPFPRRDWQILTGLAAGMRSGKILRRLGLNLSGAAIRDRKALQCAAIATQLRANGQWPD